MIATPCRSTLADHLVTACCSQGTAFHTVLALCSPHAYLVGKHVGTCHLVLHLHSHLARILHQHVHVSLRDKHVRDWLVTSCASLADRAGCLERCGLTCRPAQYASLYKPLTCVLWSLLSPFSRRSMASWLSFLLRASTLLYNLMSSRKV